MTDFRFLPELSLYVICLLIWLFMTKILANSKGSHTPPPNRIWPLHCSYFYQDIMQVVEFCSTLTWGGTNVPLTLEKPSSCGWLFFTNQHLLFALKSSCSPLCCFLNIFSPNTGQPLFFFFHSNVTAPSQCILRPFTMKEVWERTRVRERDRETCQFAPSVTAG